MNYIVKTLSMTGRGNKILRHGQMITEKDINGSIEYHLRKGNIQEYIEKIIPNIDPIPLGKNKLKVGIVTSVWKRPEIFQHFSKGVNILKQNFPLVDFVVIVSGSEGRSSKQMVEEHGFIYIEVPNDPLATKVNATTIRAGQMNCDYVLCLGSDDIIHPDLMMVYYKHMNFGYDYIGVLDFYFFDTVTKKAIYWGGYKDERRKGHTCGAGRLISARLLKQWNWKPWEIKDSKVLDNSMQTKLKVTQHSIKTFSIKDEGVFGLDIKSQTNMTPFALWDNAQWIDPKIIKEKFNYLNL